MMINPEDYDLAGKEIFELTDKDLRGFLMDHDCIEETDYGEGVNLVKTEKLFMQGHRVLNMKKPKSKVRSNVDFSSHK